MHPFLIVNGNWELATECNRTDLVADVVAVEGIYPIDLADATVSYWLR